ncbi:MAG: TolC family protein [Deltaproteobacteria bacterium]|nr:TolC family protein [Deltaproteobacteria bacterium]
MKREANRISSDFFAFFLVILLLLMTAASSAAEGTLNLEELIREALKNSPEIGVSGAKASASTYRIPQATSLSDPMLMFGYQNEGTSNLYSFNNEMAEGSQWMFSASQLFPFPGKRSLKGEMAAKDTESLNAVHEAVKLNTVGRVKELYYDLFLTYNDIDLIRDKMTLFARVEDAALARYSSGMAPQQEVLMAQTEKYMLLEKEEMLRQRLQSLEAMLNAAVGREIGSPLGRPGEPAAAPFGHSLEELLKITQDNSPVIKSKEKMLAGAEAKVQMAKKEYYPDFTVNASYYARNPYYQDMWSLTTTLNIPIFYKTKQKQAVLEATAALAEAKNEKESAKLMATSAVRDNYAMLKAAERLKVLYRDGLIPKAYQDFEQAIAGYISSKVEAITVVTRLKALIDYELLYWGQFVAREKAVARLESIAGITDSVTKAVEK